MKRTNIFLTALLLCIGMGARADNVVAISSAEGAPGDEVTVSVGLANTDALSSLQLSIPWDENLSLVEGSVQVGSRCAGHAANVGVKDGALQVVVYSLSMQTIAPSSGDVATFRIKLGNEPVSVTLQSTRTVLTDGNGNTVSGSCQSGTVTIRCAKAQFDTDEIDFGRVPIRSTYTRDVAVTNVGNADLVVSDIEFSDVNVFSSTTQLPKTITPGSTAYINVTFAPTERGATERQLRIVSNSATRNRAIKLKALPYAVNELHIGDASGVSDEEVTITMRMNNMDDISGYQVEFVLPSSLQYVDGSFAIDDSRKQDHTGAASIVDGTLRLLAYSPSGKPLKGNDGEIGSFRVKLVGRNSVYLKPVKTVLSATINNKVENVVSDVYGGQVSIQYPAISTDGEIDFGAVSVTEECKRTFSINNYGSAPLTISRIVFNNEHLSVEEAMPLVIQSWESSNVTVVYSSTEQTAFEAKMQIYSNDPDRRLHEVNVRGSRFAPNYLSMQIPAVFEEETVKVNLSVNTYDEVTGLQFDMEYPNSVYEPFDDNIQLSERAKGMTVSSRQMSPNTIRYVCYFLGGGGIAAGEGEVMSISLKPVAEVTPVGTYTVSIKNVKLGTAELADKYAGSDVSGTFQVKKHNPVTITAKSYTRLYGDANPTFEYTSEGAAVVGQPEFSCEATVTSPVGVYPIHITKGSVTNEEDTYVDGTLTITQAPLMIAAGTYTKKQGEENPEFVLSYEGFKNNETKDVLTKQAKVVCEAIASSAPGEYPVTVSGAEAQNYEISYVDGKLIVTDADPVTVTANSYTIAYGDAIPELGYTSSGATLDGTPTISCEATSASPVGTYPIVISKGSVTNYNDSYVNGTLTITKAPLTVSVGNYTRKQGEANPDFVISYNGFKNNETEDVLTTKPTATTSATDSSEPGEYEIVVSGGEAQNYELLYKSGKLIVTDADPIKLIAKSYSREYGEANPVFEFTVEGAALEGEPEIICEATATSPVGEYPIIIRKGSVKNYNDSYVNGVLTITKAPLTIAAGTYTKKQGEENPEFTLTYDGFKNNETKDVLTKQAKVVCEAIASSAPGEYPVTVSGAEAQNYEISYVDGKLVVTDADPIKLIAKSYSREYGEANPVFEFTVEGAALDGEPEIICEATATSPVGDYPIIIKKGSVKNYNDSYVNGVLTITKAPLTIAAGTYTKKQGEENPEFVLSYEGFKNNETKDVLTKQAKVVCEAVASSAPGEYPVTVSGAEAQNYEISYVDGKLIVTDADPVTVTANSYTIAYGDAIPELGYTSSGATLDGTPTISCEATSASPVGTYPIVISKGSVTNYNDSYVNGVLTITKAPLTIAAGTYTKKQGEENPEFVLSYEGFKNNETEDVLTTKPTATTSATDSSEPGEYEIVVSGGEAQNYELSYKSGKLTIIDADPVTVTANSYTIVYGDAIPELGYTSSGATLDGTPAISCEATSASPVGTYPIVISKGSVTNYNDSYVNGTLTITKAPLTIAAGTYTKKQGEENPEFVLSYEGFKNNETKDVLTKQAKVVCEAIASSAPGEYPVTVSGAEAQNYEISYVSGKLIVTDADPIKLTAKSYTREYGDANPVFEFTVEGAALDGEPEIICEATATSPVGDYPIIIKKGSVKNYNDSYVNGVLTITKAPLTVTADDINMEEWSPELPTLTLTYEGWKNGEDESVLIEKPIATTSATTQSPVGEYPIVVSGGKAVNYSFIYVNGKFIITEPDGINAVKASEKRESIYDLNGRPVQRIGKGVYIKNGKKVLIK